jgi:uncharacterized protein
MKLTINLRHLEKKPLHLEGELPAQALELEGIDEMIRVTEPLHYALDVERVGQNVIVQGNLRLTLECECVRCLKPFKVPLEFDNWVADLPLTGEEAVAVENDCVDLTPFIREDILLAFPQHPLCETDCSGLPEAPQNQSKHASGATPIGEVSSAWAELNKLKF